MRKNRLLAAIAIGIAVIMTATACGSKDNTKSGQNQESSVEASTAETTKTKTEESKNLDQTSSEESEAVEETAESAQKTSSQAGSLVSGVFTSASGKYQITPPQGWTLESDGDESVVAFTSPNGSDMLEVTYVEGEEADSQREVYPDTKEEYGNQVGRGEDFEFVRYNVENGKDGSQTFRYAIRYKNPEDGVRYYAISGSYDGAAKRYISAAGTVESPDSGVEGQIEAALDSLKIK